MREVDIEFKNIDFSSRWYKNTTCFFKSTIEIVTRMSHTFL